MPEPTMRAVVHAERRMTVIHLRHADPMTDSAGSAFTPTELEVRAYTWADDPTPLVEVAARQIHDGADRAVWSSDPDGPEYPLAELPAVLRSVVKAYRPDLAGAL